MALVLTCQYQVIDVHCINLIDENCGTFVGFSVNFVYKNCIHSTNLIVNNVFLDSALSKIKKYNNYINLQTFKNILYKVNSLFDHTRCPDFFNF